MAGVMRSIAEERLRRWTSDRRGSWDQGPGGPRRSSTLPLGRPLNSQRLSEHPNHSRSRAPTREGEKEKCDVGFRCLL